MANMPACHAGDRGFDSSAPPLIYRDNQSVERGLKIRVPVQFGSRHHAEVASGEHRLAKAGRGFESRLPLHKRYQGALGAPSLIK